MAEDIVNGGAARAPTECADREESANRAYADGRMTLGVLQFLQRRMNGRRPHRPLTDKGERHG